MSDGYEKVVSYVGLRADEEDREGGDYSKVQGVESVFPLREWGWGLNEVLNYLNEKKITIPARTDCDCCFYQRISEWFDLWKNHPKEYEESAARFVPQAEIHGLRHWMIWRRNSHLDVKSEECPKMHSQR